jgi:hypothetical protein
VTYTGHDNVFIAVPERGPSVGLTDVPYLDRFYLLHITTDVGASFPNIRKTLFGIMQNALLQGSCVESWKALERNPSCMAVKLTDLLRNYKGV